MKKYIVSIGLALLVFLAWVTPVFAITLPDLANRIDWVGAYRNYLEVGDQMYVMEYHLDYTVNPTEDINEAYVFRLFDGTTDLGATVAYAYFSQGYNHGVVGLYFSAATAPTWANVDTYTAKMMGSPTLAWAGGVPPTTSTLMSYSYDGTTTQATSIALTAKFRALFQSIEASWITVDLVQVSNGKIVLTTGYGEDYAMNSVPGIRTTCPELFQSTMSQFSYVERDYNQTYATGLQNRLDGTSQSLVPLTVSTGLSKNWVGAIIGVGISALVGLLAVIFTGKGQMFLLVFGIGLVCLTYAGVVPMLITVLCFIGVALIVINTFFYRGA